jgi:cell division transport system permease protein
VSGVALLRGRGADRVVPPGVGSALSIGFVAATMAFLGVLTLALALAAGRLADQWSGTLGGAATLHVFAEADAVEAQALAALNVLRTTPGVRSVRVVEVEEQRAMLAPWFGGEVALDALPLPLLIDVDIDRETLNRESLELRLKAEAPGAVFDDHSAWRGPLVVTAERLRVFAFACLGLMTLTLGAVIALASTAAIAANGQVIQTLRQIGARDSFIGGAFTRRFTAQATAGAAVGAAAGMALLAVLPAASEEGFFLVGVGLRGWHWLAPLAVPLVCGAVAWIATRLAARANLRRWS